MSENAIGYDQVDEDGNPLPVGYFVSGGKAQEKEDGIQLKLVLHNRTTNPPRFECDVKARYYFNIKELLDAGYGIDYIVPRIDYDQEAGYTNNKSHAVLSDPVKYDDNGTYYVDVTWKDCKFYGSRVYQFALTTKMDPETNIYPEWDSSNDYSYDDLVSFEDDNAASAITDKVTLYADDKLIWGVEPDGTTAESVAPTASTTTTNKTGGSTTTTTTKPISSTDKTIAAGDANCDGQVDMSDIVLIMQSLANPDKYGLKGSDKNHITEQGEKNADVDTSSKGVTSNDALRIQEFLLGKVKSL